MNWHTLKNISVFFLIFLLLSLITNVAIVSFVEYGTKDASFIGCFAYDALLYGIKCQGFFGQSIITTWLNWPLWLVYAPIFSLFSFKALIMALIVWLPLITYFLSVFMLQRLKK
jgi:hypothetical protein